MTDRARPPAPDQAQRDAATYERKLNVLIDAGAGTGKTSTLVDRLVEHVAPTRESLAVPIGRIAAITFTRKAAGELRLRIRERLLATLAREPAGTPRDGQLREALAGLDTAWVGTIHGFADRLLRLRPVEAGLSPSYEIAEDDEPLIRETFELLIQSVEAGTLASELAGTGAERYATEATRAVLAALATGLQAETRETEWAVFFGLDALVAGFARLRDVPVDGVEPAAFDVARSRAAVDEFSRLAADVRGTFAGADWIRATRAGLLRLREVDDPIRHRQELSRLLGRKLKPARKGKEFGGEAAAWRLWQRFSGEDGAGRSLKDELRAAGDRWLATRLARLSPVVAALYDRVKARRRALDSLDLLAKLRDLLAKDLVVRGEFQRMFDHVFVDEFQDTDPLQAEVVLFLCEREPRATRWEDVVLSDGKLTLVGDPKQSIYRFRRADVAMYDGVRRLVARRPHVGATLSANFRSVPAMIDWINDRFGEILGRSQGEPFDPATGRVYYQPLEQGRAVESAGPAVHVVEFGTEGETADEARALEGRALAETLRAWVESGGRPVVDPLDGRSRPMRYGDIAVLAVSTWRLSLLFEQLDLAAIPYASRGGRLFLEDPLHRQFILGLRALADRDDGVAEAALLRPPFFDVDPGDLAAARRGGGARDAGGTRLAEARERVADLRRRRFERPPGTTARDLLEHSHLARAVAAGTNGAQRLSRLREICHLVAATAAAEGIDYDAVTARFREWIENPAQVDPPHPVATQAVQVLTVHQAKGLEFPVVAIWDGRGQWSTRPDRSAWRVERNGRGWMMQLAGLEWEEPEGTDIREMDRSYLDEERKRIVYVAATRARDLLVVPKAGRVEPGRHVCGDLLRPGVDELVSTSLYEAPVEVRQPAAAPAETEIEVAEDSQTWRAAVEEAARPRFSPEGVTSMAHEAAAPAGEAGGGAREGRFGSRFGTAVHHAIGLVLTGRAPSADEAVRRAARRFGLDSRLEEAGADVRRALEALGAAGLLDGTTVRLEYPVAGAWPGGRLLGGSIDLVAATEERLVVVDFKTDAPPEAPLERTAFAYVAQVRAYGRLLAGAGLAAGRRVRCGLLFTADGTLRWVDDP